MPVPERLVREATHDGVTHDALSTTLPAPRIRIDQSALDHRPIGLESLPDGFEAELVETTERGQIGRGEGSLEHVEVFWMGSVGTSILEDLDPYPATGTRTPTTPSTAKSPFGHDSAARNRAFGTARELPAVHRISASMKSEPSLSSAWR